MSIGSAGLMAGGSMGLLGSGGSGLAPPMGPSRAGSSGRGSGGGSGGEVGGGGDVHIITRKSSVSLGNWAAAVERAKAPRPELSHSTSVGSGIIGRYTGKVYGEEKMEDRAWKMMGKSHAVAKAQHVYAKEEVIAKMEDAEEAKEFEEWARSHAPGVVGTSPAAASVANAKSSDRKPKPKPPPPRKQVSKRW